MKKIAIFKICLMGVLIIFLLTILIVGINNGTIINLSCGPNFSTSFNYSNASSYQIAFEELKYSKDEIKEIDINWYGGSIIINDNYDGEEITISEEITKDSIDEDYRLHYLLEDNELIIQFCKSTFNVKKSMRKIKTLTVNIPASYLGEIEAMMIEGEIEYNGNNQELTEDSSISVLSLQSVSGIVNLKNTYCKSLDIENVSGKVNLENVFVKGEVDIQVVSSVVTTTNLQCQSFSGEGVSGNFIINGIIDDIDIEVVSGKIELDLDNAPTTISTNSVSGAVKLSIPDNDGFTAVHKGLSGKLNVDSKESLTIKDNKAIYKDGTKNYKFQTVSGNVTIIVK